MTAHAPLGAAARGLDERENTRALVALVDAAAELVAMIGETAFGAFRASGSRWRRGEWYVFVLDPDGDVLVHPDPVMEGHHRSHLVDVDGTPVVRGLIAAATTPAGRPGGWFHYRWPVPGGTVPRLKRTYVRLVHAPSGSPYIVGAGLYTE